MPALRARFMAMPEAGRELYRTVRDAYEKQSTQLDTLLVDNLAQGAGDRRQAGRPRLPASCATCSATRP